MPRMLTCLRLPVFVLILLTLVVGIAPAQCAKPPVPAAGLPTAVDADVPVTYADGYKTLATFTYPSTTPPACGWPLIVFVHGYGGRRTEQRALASRGFAVVAYDVRGQGDARSLNPTTVGLTLYGAAEKYDLAEIILFARARWKALLNPGKVGVTGASQGGIHSWFAAAYSGQPLSIPGRGTLTFPKIDAVVPMNFIPDAMHHFLRDDTLFALDGINRVFGGNTSAVLEPSVQATIQSYFLNQDPAGLAAWARSDPGRAVAPELLGHRVPILYMHAYLDGVESPREAIRVVETLPVGPPLRALISTIGHGSPNNNLENTLRNEQRFRWFDRYLWDLENGVEHEAPAVMGVVPVREADLLDPAFLWDHRFDASFRPADALSARHYLTAAGSLSLSPGPGGAPTTLVHQVATGYDPATFVSSPTQWQTSTVLSRIPLSERAFTAPPLTTETELAGSPRVSLAVVPRMERFTLAAVLLARIPGATRDFMLCNWGRGVIGASPGVPVRLEFDLGPAYHVLPAGTVLKLVVRNHWLREFPMTRAVVTAPCFVSGQVEVQHGTGAAGSWIDLPFRTEVRVGLVSSIPWSPVATPRTVPLTLRGGVSRAGKPYVIAAGLTGQVPGTPLPGGVFPVNVDALTYFFMLTLGSPVIPGFVGVLDSTGEAAATLQLRQLQPLPSALVGCRLTLAAWAHRSAGDLTGWPSNPVDVIFR